MDKLRMESPDLVQGNVEKIAALFPNCVTEGPDGHGGLKKAVDFDKLRQMLSGDVLEGDEAYEFTWVGKKAAMVEANKPTRQTLRPCPEESKNWDTTENLYIEGDNLQVLKLLQESYLGKVKMIYIDPPYNTGHDFIYNDHFEMDKAEYEQQTSMFDEEGNRNFTENTDSNPRFHSDWCSMMYSRLMLARNLLAEDGVMFISVDDTEVANLRKLCDEIFGNNNFVANLIWQKKFSRANDANYFSTMHDHILCYCSNNVQENQKGWKIGLLPRDSEIPAGYANPDNDPRGVWTSVILSAKSGSESLLYEITTPSGRKVLPPSGRFWSCSKDTFEKWLQDGRIWFGRDGDGIPRKKTFLSEVQQGLRPNSILFQEDVGNNQEAKQETKALFEGVGVFDGPKPVRLLYTLLKIANTGRESIILDFFSGSATTAHAVMQLNAEDGGHRKFIMVQLPEACDEKSEAYKAGYKTICDIGKERIRRAGAKIEAELLEIGSTAPEGEEAQPVDLTAYDTGFRVFKLADSNMQDVYFAPDDYSQDMLSMMESNIKPDRTALDLLFGCLLEWGLPLSMPYRSETIDGCTVHTYNDGDLIACFDENIPRSVVEAIARRQPLRAVFRDAGFTTSPEKINLTEIFKLLAPDTRVKVI